jgi:hypothetical protein
MIPIQSKIKSIPTMVLQLLLGAGWHGKKANKMRPYAAKSHEFTHVVCVRQGITILPKRLPMA